MMKSVLITGGTGSLGKAVIRELLKDKTITQIVSLSRDEASTALAQREISNSRVTFKLGDISSAHDLNLLFSTKPDLVIHAAALKHVDICEKNPTACINSNILGTLNVIQAAIKWEVPRLVLVSTDKAPKATNLYGISKGILERLASEYSSSKTTKITTFRSCNLFGSRGSVVEIFRNQITQNQAVTITDAKMSRCFIETREAARVLIETASLDEIESGDTVVPRTFLRVMLADLAEAVAKTERKTLNLRVVGLRAGERLVDVILDEDECKRTTFAKDWFVLKPAPVLNPTVKPVYTDDPLIEEASVDRIVEMLESLSLNGVA